MLPGFNNDQVEAVIDELAKVHACSWLHRDWIEKLPHMEPDPGFIQEMGHMTEVLRSIKPEWFNDLLDRCSKLFNVDVGQKVMYKEDKYGFPAASVHSDLWAANVLWKTDSEGNATSELAALIDWQGVHAGNPGADLARMLAINTSGEYRRASTDRLLQRYADKVAEHMDGNAPFTLEQIKQAYSSSLGHVMCFIGFGAPMYYNMASVVGTGPEAEANKVELLSRVRMFFEDTCDASGV
ncbi:hypothetical protein AAVH_34462 [Aphelenchoides avenae]|nr:hypothetical protein AAVH_34462 [Aphelenchus avenae]